MENSIKNESCQVCRAVGNWTTEQEIKECNVTIYQVYCNKCFSKTSIYISNSNPVYFGKFW